MQTNAFEVGVHGEAKVDTDECELTLNEALYRAQDATHGKNVYVRSYCQPIIGNRILLPNVVKHMYEYGYRISLSSDYHTIVGKDQRILAVTASGDSRYYTAEELYQRVNQGVLFHTKFGDRITHIEKVMNVTCLQVSVRDSNNIIAGGLTCELYNC